MSLRTATVFLGVVITLTVPLYTVHALSDAADKMCTPFYAECGCDQVPDPKNPGKCKPQPPEGELPHSNVHGCGVETNVCFDKTNGHTTNGICSGPIKCQGMLCDGKPCPGKPDGAPASNGSTPTQNPPTPTTGGTNTPIPSPTQTTPVPEITSAYNPNLVTPTEGQVQWPTPSGNGAAQGIEQLGSQNFGPEPTPVPTTIDQAAQQWSGLGQQTLEQVQTLGPNGEQQTSYQNTPTQTTNFNSDATGFGSPAGAQQESYWTQMSQSMESLGKEINSAVSDLTDWQNANCDFICKAQQAMGFGGTDKNGMPLAKSDEPSFLEVERAPLMQEVQNDPKLRELISAVIAKETDNTAGATAVLESMVNRAIMNGDTSLYQTINSGFYGPVNTGAVSDLRAEGLNQGIIDQGNAAIEAVANGSNTCNMCTDQGMINEVSPNGRMQIGGEYFGYMNGSQSWSNQQTQLAADYAAAPAYQYANNASLSPSGGTLNNFTGSPSLSTIADSGFQPGASGYPNLSSSETAPISNFVQQPTELTSGSAPSVPEPDLAAATRELQNLPLPEPIPEDNFMKSFLAGAQQTPPLQDFYDKVSSIFNPPSNAPIGNALPSELTYNGATNDNIFNTNNNAQPFEWNPSYSNLSNAANDTAGSALDQQNQALSDLNQQNDDTRSALLRAANDRIDAGVPTPLQETTDPQAVIEATNQAEAQAAANKAAEDSILNARLAQADEETAKYQQDLLAAESKIPMPEMVQVTPEQITKEVVDNNVPVPEPTPTDPQKLVEATIEADKQLAANSKLPEGITPQGTPDQRIDAYKQLLAGDLNNKAMQGGFVDQWRSGLVDELNNRVEANQKALADLPATDRTPEQEQQYKDLQSSIASDKTLAAQQAEILNSPSAKMNAEQLQTYIDNMKSTVDGYSRDTPGIVSGIYAKIDVAQAQLDALTSVASNPFAGQLTELTSGPAPQESLASLEQKADEINRQFVAAQEPSWFKMAQDISNGTFGADTPISQAQQQAINTANENAQLQDRLNQADIETAQYDQSQKNAENILKNLPSSEVTVDVQKNIESSITAKEQLAVQYAQDSAQLNDFMQKQLGSLSDSPVEGGTGTDAAHVSDQTGSTQTSGGIGSDVARAPNQQPINDSGPASEAILNPPLPQSRPNILSYDSSSGIGQSGVDALVKELPGTKDLSPAAQAQAADAIRNALVDNPDVAKELLGTNKNVIKDGDIVFPDKGTLNLSALNNPSFRSDLADNIRTDEKTLSSQLGGGEKVDAFASSVGQSTPQNPVLVPADTNTRSVFSDLFPNSGQGGIGSDSARAPEQSGNYPGDIVTAQNLGSQDAAMREVASEIGKTLEQEGIVAAKDIGSQDQGIKDVSSAIQGGSNLDIPADQPTELTSTGPADQKIGEGTAGSPPKDDTSTQKDGTNCASESCVGGEIGDSRARPLTDQQQALQDKIDQENKDLSKSNQSYKDAIQLQKDIASTKTSLPDIRAGLSELNKAVKSWGALGDKEVMANGLSEARSLASDIRSYGNHDLANKIDAYAASVPQINSLEGARIAINSGNALASEASSYLDNQSQLMQSIVNSHDKLQNQIAANTDRLTQLSVQQAQILAPTIPSNWSAGTYTANSGTLPANVPPLNGSWASKR